MGALPLLSLGACDVPTMAPIIESRWVVPAQSTSISVANLLPTGVTVAGDSSGFMVSAPTAFVSRRLSDDCPACAAANGSVVPKPAFTVTTFATSALPADIATATLVAGTLQVSVTNNFTFDPLRPSAAALSARGWAVITVVSGTTVLGRDSVNGADVALPANGTLSRSIPLAGAFTGATPLTLSVQLNSPAGDNTFIDASRTIVVSLSATGLKVASARVNVVGRSLTSTSSMSLGSIDSTVTNHVLSGALRMAVTNPFSVEGNLTARFAPDGGTAVVKSVPLTVGTSSPSVTFTAQELRALLGHTVTLTLSGAVTSMGGAVSISPKQVVLVITHLDIALEVGR